MKYFFSSDYHLGHLNIIRYCDRPFQTLEEMDETIIRNHNARIGPDDVLYHVGDFCFRNSPGGKTGEGGTNKAKYYREKLNGTIFFIKGNHDKNNSVKTITERVIIGYGQHRVNLVHNPEMVSFDYKLNFVGHVHEKWKFRTLVALDGRTTDCINVGVDVNKFMPKTFDELHGEYKRWRKNG